MAASRSDIFKQMLVSDPNVQLQTIAKRLIGK